MNGNRRFADTIIEYVYTIRIKEGVAMAAQHGPGCAALTGYRADEFENDPLLWLSRVPAEDRDRVVDMMSQAAAGRQTPSIEHRFVRKEGRTRWVRNTPILYGKEAGPGCHGLIQDITEHRQAESLLRESRDMLNRVLDTLPQAIFWKDRDGLYLGCNLAFARAAGLDKPEQIVGKTDFDLPWPREEAEAYRRDDQAVLNNRQPRFHIIEPLQQADGKRLWIDTSKVPLLDDRGRPVAVLGISGDITDRKRMEEELAREKTFVEAIFNSVPGMLYLYDAKERLVRWNKKHETMSGYSAEELTDKHVLEWFAGDEKSLKNIIDGIQTTMREGTGEAEADLQKKDGTTIPMYFTGTRLTIDNQPYLTGIGIDITERKRAEEEREKLQAQLLQAQKIESVGRLAGGVAHDFNNMLNVILGHAAMALRSLPDDDPLYESLEQIQKAAARSAGLTRQLLAFARKQTVEPRVLDLNRTVAGMREMLGRLIGEDIELAWRPGPDPILVEMDPSQIDQILANLCVNARDAIKGTGIITIETGSIDIDESYCAEHADCTPGAYVLLAVSDNGSGMDPATVARLFEPFFTTKEMGKGSGLGLATIYGIVRQNRGFIDVFSRLDMGTSFRVYLPRHTDETISAAREETTTSSERGNETILLVEDESMLLNMTTTMLEFHGYKVLAAGTPAEALRLSREHNGIIHLLITDVIMPEMNGRDLALLLLSRHTGLKVLFMSGYTADVIAHHGVLDEGVHFLQKPFSINKLAEKVREVLES
ncbi:MAG: PAS domain S-box protein [Thermodesulfobacteriota bacterium]